MQLELFFSLLDHLLSDSSLPLHSALLSFLFCVACFSLFCFFFVLSSLRSSMLFVSSVILFCESLSVLSLSPCLRNPISPCLRNPISPCLRNPISPLVSQCSLSESQQLSSQQRHRSSFALRLTELKKH